jgi:hypothetical protein
MAARAKTDALAGVSRIDFPDVVRRSERIQINEGFRRRRLTGEWVTCCCGARHVGRFSTGAPADASRNWKLMGVVVQAQWPAIDNRCSFQVRRLWRPRLCIFGKSAADPILVISPMREKPHIASEFEDFRDARWCREGARQVQTALEAERFIERVGFAACLTDARRPGPSLYIAVCGRRDAVMPRNVQTDDEASRTWTLKDELIKRGKVYYAKLARGKAMFIAPRMIPYFHAIWGLRRADEPHRLSRNARAILHVLRREWEMATADLRQDARIADRKAFTAALDELQAAMLVIPSEVYYQPKFTYIWTVGVGRFPEALRRRVRRDTALREIARCFLSGAGMTVPGELARVTGLSRPEAGQGNRALVAEGYATMLAPGWYRLNDFATIVDSE